MKDVSFVLAKVCLLIWLMAGCSYTEKIRDGKTAYERKRYYQASEMLQDEFRGARSNIERMNIAFLIGESNLKFNNLEEATKWFKTAYEGGYGSSALVQYAACLKQNEQYEEAANAYFKAGEEIGDRVKFRREIANCLQAVDWRDDEKYSPYVIFPLAVNSAYSDYSPAPVSKNKFVFTSDRPDSKGEYSYAWTGSDFVDLFVGDVKTNNVTQFDESFSTEDNEGTATFSVDGQKVVFCRCADGSEYDVHCKLFYSEKIDGNWNKPKILSFTKDGFNYRHPTFSNGDTSLIFAADIDGSTNDYDLYVSNFLDEEWQDPATLGSRINSQSREGFPFMYRDTLYYSSTFGGMGGYDIYKTYLLPSGQWAPRNNLMAPVNSGADDFGFIVNSFETPTDSVVEYGYFTSSRSGGKGFDDIYRFEKRKFFPEREPEPEEEFVYEIALDLRIFQKKYEDPEDPDSKVLMRVPLAEAAINVTEDGAQFKDIYSDEYGMQTLTLNPEKNYEFFVSRKGFFNNQLLFSTNDLKIDSSKTIQKYEEKILLDKIFYDKEIVLDNIYYDLDKAFIREDAEPTLNDLSDLLKINPDLKIQLSSHTDCRADDDHNDRLSQARADSAIKYLQGKGIAAPRLVAKGYGESSLAINCACEECTEDEHQANRRTTFKVIE